MKARKKRKKRVRRKKTVRLNRKVRLFILSPSKNLASPDNINSAVRSYPLHLCRYCFLNFEFVQNQQKIIYGGFRRRSIHRCRDLG